MSIISIFRRQTGIWKCYSKTTSYIAKMLFSDFPLRAINEGQTHCSGINIEKLSCDLTSVLVLISKNCPVQKIFTASNISDSNFSQTSVCSNKGGGVPCDHYPWSIGPHCTASSPRHQTWHLPSSPSPATDIWWSSLETCCSLEDLPSP